MSKDTLPTRQLGGITVPDTPLISKAIELARKHQSEAAFTHVMRSFLFGFAIADKIPPMAQRDRELHAIAAILHDLGWDPTGTYVSQDKRFEVDGANAARQFIEDEGADWDRHRKQILWDSIALHSTPSIANHKESEVQATGLGIFIDIAGMPMAPPGTLTEEEWESIRKEFPREGLKNCLVDTMCWLCRTKPETTYDNFVGKRNLRMERSIFRIYVLTIDQLTSELRWSKDTRAPVRERMILLCQRPSEVRSRELQWFSSTA